jgi:hypothetical protein
MIALAFLFLILAVIFGIWAVAATVVWAGAKVLFWLFAVLFIATLLGTLVDRPRSLPRR